MDWLTIGLVFVVLVVLVFVIDDWARADAHSHENQNNPSPRDSNELSEDAKTLNSPGIIPATNLQDKR